ncbi:MAG: hypothetical protein NTX87_07845, partial [Planctomycetota bacterium]|nr:hypothetical protein [Planctomycetota bacterium]
AAMIITDGHHLPAAVVKAILRAKGVSRVAVTSDQSPLAGLPPGRYRAMGADVVLEESGLLHIPEKGCLAGSASTMLECMNHLASLDLLGLEELEAVGFHNPLRIIGLGPDAVRTGPALTWDATGRRFHLG